jgi:hypothetical protein
MYLAPQTGHVASRLICICPAFQQPAQHGRLAFSLPRQIFIKAHLIIADIKLFLVPYSGYFCLFLPKYPK